MSAGEYVDLPAEVQDDDLAATPRPPMGGPEPSGSTA
jgi:hypothetical protein